MYYLSCIVNFMSIQSIETESMTWQEQANCLGEKPSVFYPEIGESTAQAKLFCGQCVVRNECLEYALRNREKFGVWGGKSEVERRRIIRQRTIARRLGAAVV